MLTITFRALAWQSIHRYYLIILLALDCVTDNEIKEMCSLLKKISELKSNVDVLTLILSIGMCLLSSHYLFICKYVLSKKCFILFQGTCLASGSREESAFNGNINPFKGLFPPHLE